MAKPHDCSPTFHIPYWRSLLFQLPLMLSLLVIILVLSLSFTTHQSIESTLETISLKNKVNAGKGMVDKLASRLTEAQTLTVAMARIVASQPSDDKIMRGLLPHLLASGSDIVAGGGYWPEPFVFDQNRERHSFFWAKDDANELKFLDDYNDPDGPGYVNEEWYVPAKYVKPDEVYWSRAYEDPYSHQPMVTCSAPVYRDGKFFGVVTVDLKLERIDQQLELESKLFSGYAILLDQFGNVISYPQPTSDQHTQSAITKNFSNIRDFKQGSAGQMRLASSIKYIDLDNIASAIKNSDFPELRRELRRQITGIGSEDVTLLASQLSPVLSETVDKAAVELSDEDAHLALDPISGEDAYIDIHIVSGTAWKLITVMRRSMIAESSSVFTSHLLKIQVVVTAIVGVLCFVMAYLFFIKPLKVIVSQYQNPAEETVNSFPQLSNNTRNEWGALYFWLNQRRRRVSELVKTLTDESLFIESIIKRQHDMVIVSSAEGVLLKVSDSVGKRLGYNADTLPGSPVAQLVATGFDGWKRLLVALDDSDLPTVLRTNLIDLSGNVVPIRYSVSKLYNSNKDVVAILVVAQDITAELKAKALIEQHHQQLEQTVYERTSQLNEAKIAAESANHAKTLFLANMSHELRTPMHAILSFSSFGIRKVDKAEREKLAKYFQQINTSGQRLLGLLNDLLDLSKLEASRATLTFNSGSMKEVSIRGSR